MKFFHLSDLHIGLKLMNRDLREDQEYILKEITEYAEEEKPDAVVIAGDIYDNAVPSAEAVEVLDHFIKELTEAVPEAVSRYPSISRHPTACHKSSGIALP